MNTKFIGGSNPTGSTVNALGHRCKKVKCVNKKVKCAKKYRFNVGYWDAITLKQMIQLNTVFMVASGKRWHCYWYELIEGKKLRKREYGHVNRIKDHGQRMLRLIELRDRLQSKLQAKEYSRLYYHLQNIKNEYSYLKKTSLHSLLVHVGIFIKWLDQKNLQHITHEHVSYNLIYEYRNYLLKNRSNRTVNNYIQSLSNVFNKLIELKKYKGENYCKKLNLLPEQSNKHTPYQKHQAEQLSQYMQKRYPQLLFFARFVTYAFLRCAEIQRLQVGKIDFESEVIRMDAYNVKTNKSRNKKILHLFMPQLMHLKNLPPHYYVFGKDGKPGPEPAHSQYFSRRFKVVKDKFGLTKNHTIYGFRHTTVIMLIKNGVDKYEIMKYTGHTTLAAFQAYINSIFAEPPVDLSHKITMNF